MWGDVDTGRREGGGQEGRREVGKGRTGRVVGRILKRWHGQGREGTDVCGVCVASSGNKIGDEGCKALGDGLRTNSTLQTLGLGGAYGGRGGGRGVGRGGSGRDGEGCMWRGELVSVGACGFGEEGEGGGLSCVRGQLIF